MKKKILSIALVSTMALSIVACGSKSASSTTVEDVVKKMNKASKDTKGGEISATINVKASMEQEGQEYKINVSGKMDAEATNEPVVSHMNMDMEMDMAGFKQPLKSEVYTVQDEDEVTTYTCNNGEWTAMTSEIDDSTNELTEAVSDISKYITKENIDKYFEKVKLTDGKESKKDCFVVSGQLKENAFSDLMDAASGLTGSSVDSEDVPEISMPIKIYVDKKTYLPVRMSVDVKVGEIEGVKVSKCGVDIKFKSFDVDEIKVPSEALNAKED